MIGPFSGSSILAKNLKILNSFNSKCEITKISWKLCLQSPFVGIINFQPIFRFQIKYDSGFSNSTYPFEHI